MNYVSWTTGVISGIISYVSGIFYTPEQNTSTTNSDIRDAPVLNIPTRDAPVLNETVDDEFLRNHFSSRCNGSRGEFDPDAVINQNYAKWQRTPTSKYYGLSKQEIKDMWEECKELGSEFHGIIEQYLKGTLEEEPDTVEFRYFLDFWTEFKSIRPNYEIYAIEREFAYENGLVKPDLVLLDCHTGKKIIIDWKRIGDVYTNSRKYATILNKYRVAVNPDPEGCEVSMWLVVLHPDNDTYMVYEVDINGNITLSDISNM